MKKLLVLLIIILFMNKCIWFTSNGLYKGDIFSIFDINVKFTKALRKNEVKSTIEIIDEKHDWIIGKSRSNNIVILGKDKETHRMHLKVNINSNEAIPKKFKDLIKIKERGDFFNKSHKANELIKLWSLFLIPNNATYLDDDLLMHQLWAMYQNLGNEISDLNCSIWFTRKDCLDKTIEVWKCYDSERSQKYINRFIKTSKYAPYLLILPKHPDEINPNEDKDYVNFLYFKDIKIAEIPNMIDKLIKKIRENKISRNDIFKIQNKSWIKSNWSRHVKMVSLSLISIPKLLINNKIEKLLQLMLQIMKY